MSKEKIKTKSRRQKTEIYSRCCGYMRPTKNWNDGKQAEFQDRKEFKVGGTNES